MDKSSALFWFINDSPFARLSTKPGVCNFAFGNPNDPPLSGFSSALEAQLSPKSPDWFGYKTDDETAQEIIARKLTSRFGQSYEANDVILTNGAFAGLSVALSAITDPGDEIIFISPPWFFYEGMIENGGGTAIRVKMNPETFDLDLGAIKAAISSKTRGILINSPNNPTGKVYPEETLAKLADLLTAASEQNGRPIYLLSDEAYSRILFDGRSFQSPTSFYPNSFLIYTYGKTLLTPGQRMGYIALPSSMPERENVRTSLFLLQIYTGWAFPNALLQHSLPELEKLSIDVEMLQDRRDRLAPALTEMGYDVTIPEGTFYMMVRSPWQDDLAFTELLGQYKILCLPGTVVEMLGWFRLSLTGNDDMITRALPGFEKAREFATANIPTVNPGER